MDQYEKKLEDLEENVRMEQSEVSLAGEVCRLFFYLVSSIVHIFSYLNFCTCNFMQYV